MSRYERLAQRVARQLVDAGTLAWLELASHAHVQVPVHALGLAPEQTATEDGLRTPARARPVAPGRLGQQWLI